MLGEATRDEIFGVWTRVPDSLPESIVVETSFEFDAIVLKGTYCLLGVLTGIPMPRSTTPLMPTGLRGINFLAAYPLALLLIVRLTCFWRLDWTSMPLAAGGIGVLLMFYLREIVRRGRAG